MDVDDAVVSDILEILRRGLGEDAQVAGVVVEIRNGFLDSVEHIVEHEEFKEHFRVLSLGVLEPK